MCDCACDCYTVRDQGDVAVVLAGLWSEQATILRCRGHTADEIDRARRWWYRQALSAFPAELAALLRD